MSLNVSVVNDASSGQAVGKLYQHCRNERERAELLNALENYLETCQDALITLLKPVTAASNGGTSGGSLTKSMFKWLIGVDELQFAFLTLVFDKFSMLLTELVDTDGQGDDASMCVPKLLIKELRWCDDILDSQLIISKLIDMLPMMPLFLKRELITSLPEIVGDSCHGMVVTELMELVDSEHELISCILDSMANLSINDNVVENIIAKFVAKLDSAEACDLPIIMNFLFQNTRSQNQNDFIVSAIRKHVALSSLKNNKGSESNISLLLESVKSGIRFNKSILDTWLKNIGGLKNPVLLTDLDVFFLFISHSLNGAMAKKVENIVSQKVEKLEIDIQTIVKTFNLYPNNGANLAQNILQLANHWLVVYPSKDLFSKCSEHLFSVVFSYDDVFLKQDVINALITHVGSGSRAEITASLVILRSILKKSDGRLDRYGPFVNSIFDYMEDLSIDQIEIFYEAVCMIAVKGVKDVFDSPLTNEVLIILKKQLSHPADKYKTMGVIGTLAILGQLAHHDDLFEISKMLIMLCKSCLVKSTKCFCWFLDGMAELIAKNECTTEKFVTFVHESLAVSFQDDFVVAREDWETDSSNDRDKCDFKVYGVVNSDADSFLVKILPSCFESPNSISNNNLLQSKIHCLCSVWNLLQSCEKRLEGNLDSVDALLGCGLIIHDWTKYDAISYSSGAEAIFVAIFYAICWTRDLINSFSTQKHDPSIIDNCVKRCSTLHQLENMASAYCKFFTPTKLFEILPLNDTRKISMTDDGTKTNSAQLPDDNQSNSSNHDVDNSSVAESSKGKEKVKGLEVKDLRQWFRELNLTVFDLFNSQNSGNLSEDSLNILVADLVEKCEVKFCHTYNSPLMLARRRKDPLFNERRAISQIDPIILLDKVVEVTPYLMQKFETVLSSLNDPETIVDRITEVRRKEFLLNILKIIEFSLQSSAFSDSSDGILLQKFLTAISGSNLTSVPDLYVSVVDRLSKLTELSDSGIILYHLIKIMDSIKMQIFENYNEVKRDEQLNSMLFRFVRFEWADKPLIKENVFSYLFNKMIESADEPHLLLEKYVCELFPALMSGDAEILEQDVFLTKEQFPVHYKLVFGQLSECFKRQNKNLDVDHIYAYVKIFTALVNLVKSADKRSILAHTLRQGKLFIDAFSKYGITALMDELSHRKAEVTSVFKLAQQGTRVLQSVCGHSKEYKDLQLTSAVPALRKSLETLLYTVKEILARKDALAAFWIGNLKHRSIKGDVLSSQLPSTRKRTRKESDEENDEEPDGNIIRERKSKSLKVKRERNVESNPRRKQQVKQETRELSASIVQDSDDSADDCGSENDDEDHDEQEDEEEAETPDYERTMLKKFLASIAEEGGEDD